MIRLKTLHTEEPLLLTYDHPDCKYGLGVLLFPSGISLSLRYFRAMRDNPRCGAHVLVDNENERELAIQCIGLATDEPGIELQEPPPPKKRRGRPRKHEHPGPDRSKS
jgi:hypothetical protein